MTEVHPEVRIAYQLLSEYVAGVEDEGPFVNQLVTVDEYVEDVVMYGFYTKSEPGVTWTEGVRVDFLKRAVQQLN